MSHCPEVRPTGLELGVGMGILLTMILIAFAVGVFVGKMVCHAP